MSLHQLSVKVAKQDASTALAEKLSHVGDETSGHSGRSPTSIPGLEEETIRKVVVTPQNLAVLLEDGRVVRLKQSNSVVVGGARTKSEEGEAAEEHSRSVPHFERERDRARRLVSSILRPYGSHSMRHFLHRGGHGAGGGPVLRRWAQPVNAGEVPNELIEQAVAVLQGKSRDVIIRELQRTNLDVNMAVNNLLSRDDGEHEDHDEPFQGMFSSEDFVVLGSGIMDEADFDLPAAVLRRLRERDREIELCERRGRESRASLRDLDPLGAAGSSSSSTAEPAPPTGKGEESSSTVVSDLEWWPGDNRFTAIACTHTSLLAVDGRGFLCCWDWADAMPHPSTEVGHAHPRAVKLGLGGECVALMDASYVRATIMTTSGKFASWMDPSLEFHAQRLEHPAQSYPELQGETVTEVKVSALFTVAVTQSKKAFWWGFPPVSELRQLVERAKERKKKLRTSSEELIVEGAEVCMRSCPLYEAGSRVALLHSGPPKIGQLVNPMYNINDNFEVKGIASAEEKRETVEKPTLGVKRRHSDQDDGSDYSDYEVPGGQQAPTLQPAATTPYDFAIETWQACNCIFLEDSGMCGPVGRVVKVDGRYAAVVYNNRDRSSSSDVLASCRLLRKDDLMTSQEAKLNHSHLCYQDSPKRIAFPSDCKILGLTAHRYGVFAVVSSGNILRVGRVDMLTGKVSDGGKFPDTQAQHFAKQQSCTLYKLPSQSNEYLLRDELGGLYVLSERSRNRGLKDIVHFKLPPVQSVAISATGASSLTALVALQRQNLMPHLLQGEVGRFAQRLEEACQIPEAAGWLTEVLSGGNNILHVLADISAPTPSVPGGGDSQSKRHNSASMRELFRRASRMANSSASSSSPLIPLSSLEYLHHSSSDEGEGEGESDGLLRCIKMIQDAASVNPGMFLPLMQARNLFGMTPFMFAVYRRSYHMAIELFQLATSLTDQQSVLLSAVCPPDSHPDDSPLIMLCRNDSCSFTWTGEEHINQDIFECRTCDIVDSYCCCTECAYTCHRGHDCSFKKALPTAYCDCWQKCKCSSLAQGSTSQRKRLLQLLLMRTTLTSRPNARGENVVAMLVNTVARQSKEQAMWRLAPKRRGARSRGKPDLPAHDLSPPSFATVALRLCCERWEWLKACLSSGLEEHLTPLSSEGAQDALRQSSNNVSLVDIFKSHASTTQLDNFTYNLMAKLPAEYLHTPLSTMVYAVEKQEVGAEELVSRFLRSVVRVFTLCSLDPCSTQPVANPRKKPPSVSAVEHAKIIFAALAPLAVGEIVDMATSLVEPVTMGTCRSLTLTLGAEKERFSKAIEDLFALPPPSLLRTPAHLTPPPTSSPEPPPPTPPPPPTIPPEFDVESDGDEEGDIGNDSDVSLSEYDDADSFHDEDEWEMMETGVHDPQPPPAHSETTVGQSAPSVVDSNHWAIPRRSETAPAVSTITPQRPTGAVRTVEVPQTAAMLLAKSFSTLLRILTALLNRSLPSLSTSLKVEGGTDTLAIWSKMEGVVRWLTHVLDTTEKQLRLGNAVRILTKSSYAKPSLLTAAAPPPSGSVPDDHLVLLSLAYRTSGLTSVDPSVAAAQNSAQRDCLSYLNSLMHWKKGDHGGHLPAVDVGEMEHVALILEGFLHLLYHLPTKSTPVSQEGASEESCSPNTYFCRSQSVSCLSMPPLSPFEPLQTSLPLADKPHLLQPSATKRDLFGGSQTTLEVWPKCGVELPAHMQPIAQPLCVPAGEDRRLQDAAVVEPLPSCVVAGLKSSQLAASVMLGRWSSCIELFMEVFGERLTHLPNSLFGDYGSYKEREKKFRKEMEGLRAQGVVPNFVLEVDRNSERLLEQTIREVNAEFEMMQRKYPSVRYWQPGGMEVTFCNEPGEGAGVRRSFFTAIAEVVLSQESQMPHILDTIESILKGEPNTRSLFYQPGKPGFFAIRYGSVTPQRKSAYQCIGRLIALSLLHCELFPLKLCRHVIKYLMGRPIHWHDFAFYDPVMYDSLRQLIVEAQKPSGVQHLEGLHLTFQVQLREEEGGGIHDLCINGGGRPVTPDNVFEYVQKYTLLRMVTWCELMLKEMQQGVNDVLPSSAFDNLTAEDLHLLMNGSPVVDVEVLKKITSFMDESHQPAESVTRFKQWFWSVVEKMSNEEKHDLINFWTSSPSMPADPRSYQPQPSITVRPADEVHLPTANTCISRLYLPMYSSKHLLRTKLLQAITTKVFGFV